MAKRTKNTETTETTTTQAATAEATAETKPTKKTRDRKAKPDPKAEPTATPEDADELCVWAMRVTRAERDLLHKAAGPARASKFVRALVVAAATNDRGAIDVLLTEAKARLDG